jgi:hypothetical protein
VRPTTGYDEGQHHLQTSMKKKEDIESAQNYGDWGGGAKVFLLFQLPLLFQALALISQLLSIRQPTPSCTRNGCLCGAAPWTLKPTVSWQAATDDRALSQQFTPSHNLRSDFFGRQPPTAEPSLLGWGRLLWRGDWRDS